MIAEGRDPDGSDSRGQRSRRSDSRDPEIQTVVTVAKGRDPDVAIAEGRDPKTIYGDNFLFDT